jgi:MFS family permease
MYSLLTPVRQILNPRFDLKTPLETELLYLAPGFGYLIGVHIGGRWADSTVRRWTKIRGYRLPEDRLRSSFVCMGVILPGAMLLYGWAVDKGLGGMPLPIICMVVQGAAQLAAFPGLNAYFLDVAQERSGEATCKFY